MLNLDSSLEGQRRRTLASYRAEKQERRNAKDPVTGLRQKDDDLRRNNDLRLREDYINWDSSKRDRGRAGNRFNTILEEDTSDGF